MHCFALDMELSRGGWLVCQNRPVIPPPDSFHPEVDLVLLVGVLEIQEKSLVDEEKLPKLVG